MEGALAVNGFTETEATDTTKQSEAELVLQFIEWTMECADRTLAGQNVGFDRAYLSAACERAHLQFDFPYRTIDAHTLCYMHMIKNGVTPPFDPQHKRTNLNLNTVLQYCGIPTEPNPHNALTGAKCHAEVTARLLYGRALLPEFSSFPVPW